MKITKQKRKFILFICALCIACSAIFCVGQSTKDFVNVCCEAGSAEFPLSSGDMAISLLRPMHNYLTVPEVKTLGTTGSIIENHYKIAGQRISLAFLFYFFIVSILISVHFFPVYLFDRVTGALYQNAIIRFIHSKDGKKDSY